MLSIIAIVTATVALASLSLANTTENSPITLEIEPVKRIYSSREGVMVKFVLKATDRVKLCLAKDILSQVQVNIHRSGSGKMGMKPLVLRDNSEIFQQRLKVRWLESGESVVLRANLKRFQFANGTQWTPGEYHIGATFNLCEQTPNEEVTVSEKEIPIQSTRTGWFMIMS